MSSGICGLVCMVEIEIEVDLEIEIGVEMRIWIGGGKREVGDSDVFKTPEPPPTVT